jgi:beta-glucosidase
VGSDTSCGRFQSTPPRGGRPIDITKIKKIAIVGKHADIKFGRKKTGGGSAAVNPPYEITVRQGLENKCKGKIEIVKDPKDADVAICCIGLEHTHDFKGGDHEGSDRLRYGLGIMLNSLVKRTVAKNPNTIVVCLNGSPFEMESFVDKVPAILEAWYGGMEVGNVVADILFGDVNPSGKLPITFVKKKKEIPTLLSLMETIKKNIPQVVYVEDVFIGYRYYDNYDIEPRFCFGHGLSYTQFKYDNLKLSTDKLVGNQPLTISFEVTNVGKVKGAEIVQLYISDKQASVPRPPKELKGFKKVYLEPNQREIVTLQINLEDLSFYDENMKDWRAEDGDFEVMIGASSRDIRLSAIFKYVH